MISSIELARLCGLSQGTVDRALHDRPGISAQTKARVLAMAQQHGYRPHPAARELLTGERRTVGAIVPAVNSVFFMDLLNTIRQAMAGAGLRMILTPVGDAAEALEALEEFAARRARLVVAIAPDALTVPAGLTRHMPVVMLINRGAGAGVINLMPDERQTGRTAARYLLARGHRRILHLAPGRDSAAIRDRAAGYSAEMQRRRLKPHVLRSAESAELIDQVKRTKATALFCHNDWLALSAIRLLNQAELRVPGDVSVLGVDDSPTFVSLCPDITTLHYPAESIAAAVRRVADDRAPGRIAAAHIVERHTVRPLSADAVGGRGELIVD